MAGQELSEQRRSRTVQRAVLTTRNSVYRSVESLTMAHGAINAGRLVYVEDDNGKRLWLNPAAVVTVQDEDCCK